MTSQPNRMIDTGIDEAMVTFDMSKEVSDSRHSLPEIFDHPINVELEDGTVIHADGRKSHDQVDEESLTDDDRKLGKEARQQALDGHNPASWVADEDKWEKAKDIVKSGKKKYNEPYAVITHIYLEKLGGKIK